MIAETATPDSTNIDIPVTEFSTTHPLPAYFQTQPPPSYKEIGKALIWFQNLCPVIHQNSKNPFGDYSYADLSVIVETIKPHLHKAGLAYTQLPYMRDGKVGVQTIVIHGDSGETLESNIDMELDGNVNKKMTPIQGVGSVITYLRRYSLSAMLGLVTEDDPDGYAEQTRKATTKKATTKQEPKAEWLTEDQFNKAMKANQRGVSAVLKKYNTATHKMKKDYKEKLENRLKMLQDG